MLCEKLFVRADYIVKANKECNQNVKQGAYSVFRSLIGKNIYGEYSDNLIKMASTRENMTLLYAKNKAANQPAPVRSLIGAFVFPLLQNAILNLLQTTISLF